MATTTALASSDLKAVQAGGLIREDVMNKIWDISRIPLPFTDMVGSGSADNEYKEWTQDELAQPDTANAVGDGADASGNDTKTGARVGNHHQISDKVVEVTYRSTASNTIGRAKELAYQMTRRQQELRRDVEAIALFNQASVADDNANDVVGKCGGLPSWLETTTINGTAGGFDLATKLTVARTPGLKAALTETQIRDVVEGIYDEGGEPTKLMTIPAVIRKISEYLFTSSARVGTIMSDQGKSREKAAALGSVNVFVTDFGTLTMVPNRLQPKHKDSGASDDVADVFILDPEFLSLCYMQGYRTDELAKLGQKDRRQMLVDWSLIVNTEKAHGMIGDVDFTTPMLS
ncbi:MAG: hypothetical protein DRI46_12315 [Chloroflexi bacterium]|nr:MAG: hypothetical protein DRI46_12315 [Chloroflexota bacterium]